MSNAELAPRACRVHTCRGNRRNIVALPLYAAYLHLPTFLVGSRSLENWKSVAITIMIIIISYLFRRLLLRANGHARASEIAAAIRENPLVR